MRGYGDYSDVTVFHGAKLYLKTGIYNFNTFNVPGHDAIIYFDVDPDEIIEINVKSAMEFDGYRIKTEFIGEASPQSIRYYTNQSSELTIGYNVGLDGIFTAPNANINLLRDVPVVPTDEKILDATINQNSGFIEECNLAEGLVSKGLLFNGYDSRVEIKSDESLNLPEEFTIETWVKSSGSSTNILSTNNEEFGIGLESSKFVVNTDGNNLLSDTAISQNSWNSLTAVYRNDSLTIYVNGEMQVAKLYDSLNTTFHDVSIILGGILDSLKLNGTLDELRFSSCARSASWIKITCENQEDSEKMIQVPFNKPENLFAEVDNSGNVLLTVTIPEGVKKVEFQRRNPKESIVWYNVITDSVRNVFIDNTAKCEDDYEYRVRFINGYTYSDWSDSVVIEMPDCVEESELFEVKLMVLNASKTPINGNDIQVGIKLYDSPFGDTVLIAKDLVKVVKNGWLELTLGYLNDVVQIIKENRLVYMELTVNGVIQDGRIPITAIGISSMTNRYRLSGSGSPVGRVQAKVGSLYLDTENSKLYFKFGDSVNDWEVAE